MKSISQATFVLLAVSASAEPIFQKLWGQPGASGVEQVADFEEMAAETNVDGGIVVVNDEKKDDNKSKKKSSKSKKEEKSKNSSKSNKDDKSSSKSSKDKSSSKSSKDKSSSTSSTSSKSTKSSSSSSKKSSRCTDGDRKVKRSGDEYKFELERKNAVCVDKKDREYQYGQFEDISKAKDCADACVKDVRSDVLDSFRGYDFDCKSKKCNCLYDRGTLDNTRNRNMYDRSDRSENGKGDVEKGKKKSNYYCYRLKSVKFVGFESDELVGADGRGALRGFDAVEV